jgi:uncharacterized protein (DUF983 family)
MTSTHRLSAIRGIVRQVCPRCRQGPMFRPFSVRRWIDMYAVCPVCDLKFDREPGYFLGAMYVSYLLSIPPVLALVFILWLLAGWSFGAAVFGAFVAYLPFVPFMVRLSRVIWIYIDRSVDPH